MYLFQKKGTEYRKPINFQQIQTKLIITALHGQAHILVN